MQGVQILFHGRFGRASSSEAEGQIPYEGFYTSRIIDTPDVDAAITKGRELIRDELDITLLSGCQEALVSLEAEEFKRIEIDSETVINRKGFTFY